MIIREIKTDPVSVLQNFDYYNDYEDTYRWAKANCSLEVVTMLSTGYQQWSIERKYNEVFKMKNHYFTFGQVHIATDTDENGYPLKLRDYWVRVVAENSSKARDIFINEFANIRLPRPEQFAMQYSEERFNKEYFPKGELEVLYQYSPNTDEDKDESFI